MTLNVQNARNTVWNQQMLVIIFSLLAFRNYSVSPEPHSSYLRCSQPHSVLPLWSRAAGQRGFFGFAFVF